VRRTVPDLVLVNVDLRSVDGLAATRRLVRDARSAVLVTVAGEAEPARVFEAIGHGALDAIALDEAATSPRSPRSAAEDRGDGPLDRQERRQECGARRR
jgi:two-component system response regulator WspF